MRVQYVEEMLHFQADVMSWEYAYMFYVSYINHLLFNRGLHYLYMWSAIVCFKYALKLSWVEHKVDNDAEGQHPGQTRQLKGKSVIFQTECRLLFTMLLSSLTTGNNDPVVLCSSKMYYHDEEEPQRKGQVPLKNKTRTGFKVKVRIGFRLELGV